MVPSIPPPYRRHIDADVTKTDIIIIVVVVLSTREAIERAMERHHTEQGGPDQGTV